MNSIALSLLLATLGFSAPLVLASMGGYMSERSGIINIALEGNMLAAACAGYFSTLASQNAWIGLLAAILAATIMSLAHWLLTQKLYIDHIVSGMAVNIFAAGATNYLYVRYPDPSTGDLPLLPMRLFWAVAVFLPVALFFWAGITRGGLRLLAVGNDPEKSRIMGIQPLRIRFKGLVATGVFTGMAGAMIFTSAGQFSDGMTSNRGYIALAALILGGWRPLQTLAACVGFAFLQALELQLQGTKIAGADIPAEVFSAMPYIITVIALAGLVGRSKAPAGLGKI